MQTTFTAQNRSAERTLYHEEYELNKNVGTSAKETGIIGHVLPMVKQELHTSAGERER